MAAAPPAPPRDPGAQGGSLDGGGWIDAPGAGWGAHYCQLTALTGPRGVLCVHLGVPVQATVGASGPLWGPNITPVWSLVAYMGLGRALCVLFKNRFFAFFCPGDHFEGGVCMRMGLPGYWEAARHWMGIAVSCALEL